jgi:ABC-type glycerol-3-phosphate transport system substrate-binding protein
MAWAFLESTFLTAERQVQIFTTSGPIPARTDAQLDPALSGNPNVAAWITELEAAGTRSPAIDASSYLRATTTVGEVWSALRQNRITADEAVSELASSLGDAFVD